MSAYILEVVEAGIWRKPKTNDVMKENVKYVIFQKMNFFLFTLIPSKIIIDNGLFKAGNANNYLNDQLTSLITFS